MNHIHLIGRLGADPRVTPYKSDQDAKSQNPSRHVVSFNLAVERPGYHPQTGEITTDWISITVFDSGAGRFAANHLKKGDRVAVTGRLETTHRESSERPSRKSIRVVAREIIGLDYHRTNPRNKSGADAHRPALAASTPPKDVVAG